MAMTNALGEEWRYLQRAVDPAPNPDDVLPRKRCFTRQNVRKITERFGKGADISLSDSTSQEKRTSQIRLQKLPQKQKRVKLAGLCTRLFSEESSKLDKSSSSDGKLIV